MSKCVRFYRNGEEESGICPLPSFSTSSCHRNGAGDHCLLYLLRLVTEIGAGDRCLSLSPLVDPLPMPGVISPVTSTPHTSRTTRRFSAFTPIPSGHSLPSHPIWSLPASPSPSPMVAPCLPIPITYGCSPPPRCPLSRLSSSVGLASTSRCADPAHLAPHWPRSPLGLCRPRLHLATPATPAP